MALVATARCGKWLPRGLAMAVRCSTAGPVADLPCCPRVDRLVPGQWWATGRGLPVRRRWRCRCRGRFRALTIPIRLAPAACWFGAAPCRWLGRLSDGLGLVAAPTDRGRFSLAHELGHLIMHHVPGGTAVQEREADAFASDFLMPASSIRDQLRRGVDVNRLAELKPEWGTSMAALARRALDVNALSDWQYRNLMVEMSILGYRAQEPGSIEPEHASKIYGVLQVLMRDQGARVEELAATAGLFPDEFKQMYLGPSSR
jgi:IrrE N-terminal-like domain